MKRIKGILILIISMMILIPFKVNAATATLETNKTSMQVGETATITLNMTALAWNYEMSGGVSGTENNLLLLYSLDLNNLANETVTKTFSFSPTTAGTYTIVATCKILDKDDVVIVYNANNEVDPMQTYAASDPNSITLTPSITITVTAPPTNNDNNTNNNQNTNTNTNTDINKDTKKEEKKDTTKKEETKKDETKKEEIKITKFEIEGYEIKFDSKTTEYTIDINSEIKELNIKVEGNDIKVEGAGLVNIDNKDSIKITITKGTEKKEYIIKLNRKEKEEVKDEVVETTTTGTKTDKNITTTKKSNKMNIFSIVMPILLIVLSVADTILVIKKIKNKHQ